MEYLLSSYFINSIFKKYNIEYNQQILTINKPISVKEFTKLRYELMMSGKKIKNIIVK